MILDQAFRYITELKKQNDTMLLEGGEKVQGEVLSTLPLMHHSYFYLRLPPVCALDIMNNYAYIYI